MQSILQASVHGILIGAVYALFTAGLTVVYGASRLVNFAHGDLLVLGIYLTLLASSWGIDGYAAIPVVVILLAAVGVMGFRWLFQRFPNAETLPMIQLTLGMMLVIQNGLLIGFDGAPRTPRTSLSDDIVSIGSITIETTLLLATAVAVVACTGLHLISVRTAYGRSVRAIEQNRDAANLMGINVPRVLTLTFALSTGLVGLAAPLLGPLFTVTPASGLDFTLLALVVMVLGGIGNVLGTVVAGLLVGLAQSLGDLLVPGQFGQMVPYIGFVLVLVLRPAGLFREA